MDAKASNEDPRDASGRLSYDFVSIESSAYSKLVAQIAKQFGLEPSGKLTSGFDLVFQDFKQGTFTVGLEWDNWSGFTVVAKTPDSEPLTREIADFIKAKYSL